MPYIQNNRAVFKYGKYLYEHAFIAEQLTFKIVAKELGTAGGRMNFFMGFTAPATITVDWGDGNVIDYSADYSDFNYPYAIRFEDYGNGGNPKSQYFRQYFYPDGLNIERIVKIRVNNRNALGMFTTSNQITVSPDWNIGQFKFLKSFSYRGPAASPVFRGLFSLSLNSISLTLSNSNIVPIDLCFSTLYALSIYTNPGMKNLELVPNIAELQSLRLDWMSRDGYQPSQPLPPSFANLKITIFGGYFSSSEPLNIPQVLTQIKTLQTIQWPAYIDAWTDLSNLTNLTDLQILGTRTLVDHAPDFLLKMNLKKITFTTFGASGNTVEQQRALIDAAINRMFDWTVQNAPLIGTAADKARNQQRIYSANGTAAIAKPTGIYQAPTGYIKGTRNGNPANSLERLFVLVNQYNWIFTGVPLS